MAEGVKLLPELRGIEVEQSQLLALALRLASGVDAELDGEVLTCTLGDLQRRTSTLPAMAAGQSLKTTLRLTELPGLAVRDAYPVARSAVETFLNATYLLAEDEAISARALRHIPYARWRHVHRIVGTGDAAFELFTGESDASRARELFPEFVSGTRSRGWSDLDAPSRIDRIGRLVGRAAASRLLAAYGILHALSSEVLHGSPYGVSHFYGLEGQAAADMSKFLGHTEDQAEDILIAVLHAAAGYLCAFFSAQAMSSGTRREAELFVRLVSVATSDEAPGHPPRVHSRGR